jgi:iron complex transport system substrate-binding protein
MGRFGCDIPRKIICLTEESVETLYLLGKQDLIAGASIFVRRPVEAQALPKVSAFTTSKIDTIVDMRPDLVLGFSDIQKDIARDLVGAGLNVWIANQRSLQEVLEYVLLLGRLVGAQERAQQLCEQWARELDEARERAARLTHRPRVYFEEWDEPQISAIQWVSELITASGGVDVFQERASAKLAQGRFTTAAEVVERDPEIIVGCWCGKKVRTDSFAARPGWEGISAVKHGHTYEVPPEIFLQPGPALFVDGLQKMSRLLAPLTRTVTSA